MDNIMILKNPKSPVSEAYRTLRTNIQFSSIDKDIKTVLVTSSGASEGKSTTAANLAMSFVQMGKKVVIVDCDLRKPKLAKHFELSNSSGLTNILYEKEKLDKHIRKLLNIHVITSGPIPPNPAEMLASESMKALLEKLKTMYDYVVIDSPPISFVTDGAILSSICDGVLLVVASGETDTRRVILAKEQLDNVRANVLGVVMTKISSKSKGYYSKYYAQNYSYMDEKSK